MVQENNSSDLALIFDFGGFEIISLSNNNEMPMELTLQDRASSSRRVHEADFINDEGEEDDVFNEYLDEEPIHDDHETDLDDDFNEDIILDDSHDED